MLRQESEIHVIVGAGQAGGRAAQAMRRAGFTGRILLVGAEPHAPYERPPLSKELLLKGGAAKLPYLFTPDFLTANRIELRLGRAAAEIDRARQEVRLADGSRERYDRLLLATGGRLRRLALEGAAPDALHYLRTVEDALALEPYLRPGVTVLVVGGGFIGLEVAAIGAHRGARMMVIEAAPQLLPRLAAATLSAFLTAHHRRQGIDLRLGVRPVAMEGGVVLLSDGARIAADLVVVGIGIGAETALAEAAGLAVEDGILTGPSCATSDPAVFAAGDAARQFHPRLGRRLRFESWHNAQTQAEAAGRAMAGAAPAEAEVPWVWSDQHLLNIQVAGAPAIVTQTVVRGDLDAGDFALCQFDGAALVGAITVNRAREMPLFRRMLSQDRSYAASDLADPAVKLRDLLR